MRGESRSHWIWMRVKMAHRSLCMSQRRKNTNTVIFLLLLSFVKPSLTLPPPHFLSLGWVKGEWNAAQSDLRLQSVTFLFLSLSGGNWFQMTFCTFRHLLTFRGPGQPVFQLSSRVNTAACFSGWNRMLYPWLNESKEGVRYGNTAYHNTDTRLKSMSKTHH